MDKGQLERDDEERLKQVRAFIRRRRARRRRQLVTAGAATLGVVITVAVLTVTLLGRSLSQPPDRALERAEAPRQAVVVPSRESSPNPAVSQHEARNGSIKEAESAGDEHVQEAGPRGQSRPVPTPPRAALREPGRAKPLELPPRLPSSDRPPSAQNRETAATAAPEPAAAVPSVVPLESALKQVMDYIRDMHPGSASLEEGAAEKPSERPGNPLEDHD